MTALSNQYCLPEGITPEIFLRDYWQKKPLIIRNGLPEIVGQFEPDDIIENTDRLIRFKFSGRIAPFT